MASGAAADGLFRPIFEGSISGFDHCVERRPYHRNCSCALHSKSRNGGGACTHKQPWGKNISYPMRRAWSEGSLIMVASSVHSSPSSSPVAAASSSVGLRNYQLGAVSVDLETGEQHY
ncbi:uncharacterized protein LOC130969559 [Arachis stenosperma]|uniref:uncharacterized protein LOC130969559 n=1 Tax=Arachis stenosperma TaxID=217475 RepID=UPI0025AD0307|nr:uncharacterized protein LOC130969559 [Arachis stenosperma]